MTDDTLDIDELEDEEAAPESEKEKGPRGPGFFSRIGRKIAEPFAKIKFEQFANLRGLGIFVIAFLIIWLLIVNWAPVRVVLWFWTIDIPKTIAFILDVALGALLMWLWLRRREQKKPAGEGDESQ